MISMKLHTSVMDHLMAKDISRMCVLVYKANQESKGNIGSGIACSKTQNQIERITTKFHVNDPKQSPEGSQRSYRGNQHATLHKDLTSGVVHASPVRHFHEVMHLVSCSYSSRQLSVSQNYIKNHHK
jgi:hypothetical protein